MADTNIDPAQKDEDCLVSPRRTAMGETDASETPMSDHIDRFFQLLATEHVRILVNIRRQHGDGPVYWDGSSFPDNVAKAIAALRSVPAQVTEGWQLVPKEPDQDMLVHGLEALVAVIKSFEKQTPKEMGNTPQAYMAIGAAMRTSKELRAVWDAMLSASPSPPPPSRGFWLSPAEGIDINNMREDLAKGRKIMASDAQAALRVLDRWTAALEAATPAPPMVTEEEIARVINRARYPNDREPRDLSAEDKSSQEYARRLARAVLALLREPDVGERNAALINDTRKDGGNS